MLSLEARKFLFDVLQACERLESFTQGRTLVEYTTSELLRSGVERQFEIIGEAVKQMLGRHPELAAAITDHRRIIAFRNRLIHGYADIADDIVWGILKRGLPILRREVEGLLAAQDGASA